MNHSDIQNSMADYLEGDLSLDRRALFDAHLDACEPCSTELSEMRETIGLLRHLATPEAPSDLADNVMRRIAAGEGQPGWFDRVARGLSQISSWLAAPRFAVPATATAAALAVLVVTNDRGFTSPGSATTTHAAGVMARRSDGAAPERITRTRVKSSAAAVATTQAEPSSQPHARADSLVAGPRLGMRGSGLANGTSQAPAAGGHRAAGSQRLSLASVEIAGTLETASTRTRDDWLDVSIEQPQRFAREHSELSSVEQELWVRHLARRAAELERLDEVLIALRATGDPKALALADSFAAAAQPAND